MLWPLYYLHLGFPRDVLKIFQADLDEGLDCSNYAQDNPRGYILTSWKEGLQASYHGRYQCDSGVFIASSSS